MEKQVAKDGSNVKEQTGNSTEIFNEGYPKCPVTDKDILLMIGRKDTLAWQFLQTKYSAILYGAILRIVGDEAMAETVLINVFAGLKENTSAILSSKRPLCLFLLHYVYGISMNSMNDRQDAPLPDNKKKTAYPILNSLVYKPDSIADIAEVHVLTQQEVKLKLRSELNRFRNESAHCLNIA